MNNFRISLPKPARSAGLLMFALAVALLTGCSGGSTPPRELLLSPDDFSGKSVTEAFLNIDESILDGAAVLVELQGPDFTLVESLVLFESEALAKKVLSEIKQDQLAQGVQALAVEGFEDNSGVMVEQLKGEVGSTLFFVEGRGLIRLTLIGDNHAERIWGMARLARQKSSS